MMQYLTLDFNGIAKCGHTEEYLSAPGQNSAAHVLIQHEQACPVFRVWMETLRADIEALNHARPAA